MEVIITKEYVYSLLNEKGISKSNFASQLGIQRTNLDALMESKKKSINLIIKMADVLGMSLQEFIGFAPRNFKIKGFIKVGEQLREIKTEEDWYKAEQDSDVCAIPYYSGFGAACEEIETFLTNALSSKNKMGIMGRINDIVVYSISVIDDFEIDEEGITKKSGKQVTLTTLTKTEGVSVRVYYSMDYELEEESLISDITAEIKGYFYNKME